MPTHDNHMDDLFRRAAEHYPLRQSGSDWEKIAGRLSESAINPVDNTGKTILSGGGKKKKWILGLGLLVVFSTAGLWWLINEPASKYPGQDKAIKHLENATSKPITGLLENMDTRKKETITDQQMRPEVLQLKSKQHSSGSFMEPTKSLVINKDPENQLHPIIDQQKLNITKDNEPTLAESQERTAEEMPILFPVQQPLSSIADFRQVPMVSEGFGDISSLAPQVFAEDSLNRHSTHHASAGFSNTGGSKWVVGIQTGLSVSSVKGQEITRPGMVLGLQAAYRISDLFFLESGLRVTKKYYATSGEYFHMKGVDTSMPTNMEIISLEGTSNILEIPLKIKYNFRSQPKGHFFTTAGINNYILTKEANDYLILSSGNTSTMEATYNEKLKYFAATFEISGGYEFILKKKQTLRVEPYFQMAIKGIGIGSLPVSGGGLLISFSAYK